MQLSSLTFVVTEDCNFKCTYCYQLKRDRYLDESTIKKALDFFSSYLKKECFIHFYGGEPLLAFELIRSAVGYIQDSIAEGKKAIGYTISTNGSLLNDEIVGFLSRHRFSVLLSFDGLAQDVTRRKGSFDKIVSHIRKLLETPDIDLKTNSVFTPKTIGCLTRSVQFINELGVQKIDYSFAQTFPWKQSQFSLLQKELEDLRGMMLKNYWETGKIPLCNYKEKPSKGIAVCYAGRDRLDLTADAKLWGCNLFADYFKGREKTEEYAKYCFGDLDSFIEHHDRVYPEILMNYLNLRMDKFYTSDTRCIDCENLFSCGACPVDNLFSCSDVYQISRWECEFKKIMKRDATLFWEELER